MAVTYGFFNSVLVNGMQDRRYNADQMSTYFKGLISDGVYQNVGGGLQVKAGEGMTVQVMAGRGVFDSRWLENDSVLDIPLEPSHVTLNRYTAVVVRVDYNERTVSILAKDGETASTPVKPVITRSESVKEYCLAYVYVGRGVTSISQSAVTDTRPDNTLCGFVTGLVEQIQTTDLFAQYDAAFGEWFETIEDKLSGDVAGKLTVDVERLEREKQDKISGTKGQIVGFDENGKPAAQVPPDTGVTSFKGRKGAVTPQAGDYSAADVGALPISGGTLTGNLTIKGTGSYGMKINLGDGDYVHISEPTDDCLEIKAKKVNFVISSTDADSVAINGKPLAGKSLAGKSVQPEQEMTVTAWEGAEIFNDYRTRTFNSTGETSAGNVASGFYSHAEGRRTTASGSPSHAEGDGTIASGDGAHTEGYGTIASGGYSHAEGQRTTANGFYSHAENFGTTASGGSAHAEGDSTIASKFCSHAEGYGTIASGDYSHAGGSYTKASAENQTAIGKYNVESTSASSKLIIGKGTTDTARANCLRVTDTGVYASGSYNSSGADYAEFFEWLDRNPEQEDRAGLFVTLEGEKIRLARPDDDFILGIVSGEPSVCGDVYDDQWKGMYLYDIYGRPLWEDVEVPDETVEEPNPENPDETITRVMIPAHTEHRQKLNPDYDNTQPYVPRSERPEWDAVGMLGKLVVRDDGTCRVNEWCAVGENGTATYSGARTKYRVMARLDENHVRVLIL